jgi:glycosyltransferase involved in cell wall biosynthesis
VRNEARHIRACLESARRIADEVVVVDTGSTDRTVALARRHGARVSHMRWPGDFSVARNRSLALARGEWILWIDADERVRSADRRALRRSLRDPRWVAAFVRFHAVRGWTPFRLVRLFRNDPRIRFEGCMHESMMGGVFRVMQEDAREVTEAEVVMDHLGYEGDQRKKLPRNLRLLRRALSRDPTRAYNWCHLAGVYAALGRTGAAERAWRRAYGLARRGTSSDLYESFAHMGYAEWRLRRGQPAGRILDEGLARFPTNLQLRWLKARWLMARRRWAEALPLLEGLSAQDPRALDLWLPYDRRIFGVFASDSLATCHFRLKRYREAARWYARAARQEGASLEYDVKRRLALALDRRARLAAAG